MFHVVKNRSPETDLYLKYWESNVESWGRLYLSASHGGEKLAAPPLLARLYSAGPGRYEAFLMKRRYALTMEYVSALKPGSHLLDIGCGTGIFTVQALMRGCTVTAVDFAEAALNATRSAAAASCPTAGDRLALLRLDVRRDELPTADHALLVGVLPYISDPGPLMDRVLRSTRTAFIQFSDSGHWANRLRTAAPVLNVRRLQFQRPGFFLDKFAANGWTLVRQEKFATGFIMTARKGEAP